jgi:hypothetical protein
MKPQLYGRLSTARLGNQVSGKLTKNDVSSPKINGRDLEGLFLSPVLEA